MLVIASAEDYIADMLTALRLIVPMADYPSFPGPVSSNGMKTIASASSTTGSA
jgi:hypothetical protein